MTHYTNTLEHWKSQQPSIINNPQVVGYWDFQEGEGATLKNTAKTGAVLNGDIFEAEWSEGRWPGKKALVFNGKSSLVSIPFNPALSQLDKTKGGTGELTLEAWIKPIRAAMAGVAGRLWMDGNGTGASYSMTMSGPRLAGYLGCSSNNAPLVTADAEITDNNEWTHVAMTINDKEMILYRNGEKVGSIKRSNEVITDNDAPFLIGAITNKGMWTFHGLIDEVVFYNKALSDTEIEQRALSFSPTVENAGPPSISILYPSGSTEIRSGSWQRIRWSTTAVDKDKTVKIEMSTDGGGSWMTLADSVKNTGEYVYEVALPPSKNCLVRISVSGTQLVSQSHTFSILASEDLPQYEWVNLTMDAPFAPRDGLGTLAYKERIFVIGGWNPNDKKNYPLICSNDVWNSKDGITWDQVKPNTFIDKKTFDPALDWEGRHTAGYVVFQDKMWIVGGDANQGHYMFDVWNSEDGKTWMFVNQGKPVPWGPRVLHHTVVFKNKIWIMGGQTMPLFVAGEEHFYRDIWSSSDGINWEQVIPQEPFWPQRGIIGGNVVFKDRMWVIGGGTYDTPERPRRKFYNDVWSSADGVKWQCHIEKAPWDARQYHEVATFDGRIWVLEGYGPEKKPGNRNDVWHSSDGTNWYPLPQTPWGTRHAAGVFTYDNALWVIAGNNMQSDVWKLVRK